MRERVNEPAKIKTQKQTLIIYLGFTIYSFSLNFVAFFQLMDDRKAIRNTKKINSKNCLEVLEEVWGGPSIATPDSSSNLQEQRLLNCGKKIVYFYSELQMTFSSEVLSI